MHRKISSRTLLSLFIIVPGLMLAACVPSPTATPSGRTPLPTLSSIDGTPQVVANGTAPASQTTPGATRAPRPTNASPRTTRAAQETDTFPPLVEITVQDPELPVSTKQTVALNVLAADNDTIARIDLYDNNVLYAQATAPEPAPVLFHQFQWSRSAPGKHTLRAVAFDASGNASSPAQIELNVITNNRAPGVMITAPSGLKDAEIGAPLLIQGVATDDVAVTRMELIVDNQLVTAVKPTQPEGITPFAVAIPWTPLTTGSHNIVLRAYDNQNQSDDSLRYTVRVFDNQAPVVEAKPERLNLPSGDVFLTEVLALANNGIARVELYVDEQLADGVTSSAISQQTSLLATLSKSGLSDGAHTAYVRAYDFTGQTTDTERITFNLSPDTPRIDRATPVVQEKPTDLPPTATATPPLILPPAPTIQLVLSGDPVRVVLPDPAVIEITARGSAELDRIELWGRYRGERGEQLLLEENAKGTTDKTITFNWNAPYAGIVEIRAHVTDNLGQEGESALLRFVLQPPPAPEPFAQTFTGTWISESPGVRFDVNFDEIGSALRGVLVEKRADGTQLTGKIVSGAVGDKTVLFAVDFAGDAQAPGHTLTFDCSYKTRPPTLTCNYATENNERGSAIFTPLAQK